MTDTEPQTSPGGGLTIGNTAPRFPCGPGCVRWPNPRKTRPCLNLFDLDDIQYYLEVATEDVFRCTLNRFPGCCCYAMLRPCKPCGCACACGCGKTGFELVDPMQGGTGYPILELVDVRINGLSMGTDGWAIHDHHLLVNEQGGFPALQDVNAPATAPCTWAVIVRYGAAPPAAVLAYRDKLWYQLLLEECGDALAACTVNGNVTTFNDGVRSYTFEAPHMSALARAVQRYTVYSTSMIIDPLEHLYTGRVEVESGWDPATDPQFPPHDWEMPPDCAELVPYVPEGYDPQEPAEPLTASPGASGEVVLNPVTGGVL